MICRLVRTMSVLALIILGIGSTACAERVDGNTVLRKMLESEGKVAFTAHQVTTITRGPALTSEQIVYRAGFKGMRIEYLSPQALRSEVMVDDGRSLLHYIPKEKVVRIRTSRLAGLKTRSNQTAAAGKKGALSSELVGKDEIAGRAAYVIHVKPRQRGKSPSRKFWVDTEKWVKLKTEDIAPDGTVASMSYYTRISFVNSIPEDKFQFRPPKGVRVERVALPPAIPLSEAKRKVRFRVLEPSYLPLGFKSLNASVVPFRRGQIIAIRYTDGVSSFSLFQAPGRVLDPKFVQKLHEGPVEPGKGVYSWRKGETNLTIVGQLSSDVLRKIAGSVK